jgi:hypothetical protein
MKERKNNTLDIHRSLLNVCSDVLLEARYPSAVESKSITRLINKLRIIRRQVKGGVLGSR